MLKFPVLVAGVSLLSPSLSAVAQQSSDTESLAPIKVTAPLGPRTIGESLSAVSTIETEEIRRKQPKEFGDLLRAQPSVALQTTGGIGQQTSVYLRGNEADATVLLVNGVRIRSATAGIPAWEFLPTPLVNRVEIVRGGKSSLYGADAMGGVVQVFTTPEDVGNHGWVEAGAGNLNTQRYGAGFSAVEENSSLSVGVSRFETDGSPVIKGGDDKPSENTAGTFNASHEFDNGLRLSFNYLGAEGDVEYEGGDKDFLFQTTGVGLDFPVTAHWRTSLQFSDARDEQTYYSDFGASDLNTKTRTSRLENWLVAGMHEFIVGAETRTDQVSGSTDYDENSRRNDAFFGQALFNFGATDINLSLRTDDNEAFGSHETWGAALGHGFSEGYRLKMSAGTAFKAPTFNDLYSPWAGNPNLEPEEAISYEVGLEKSAGPWYWGMAVYHSEVDNLIVSSFPNPSMNSESATLKGVELEAGWQHSGWEVAAAVSAGGFEDETTGNHLPYRAEQTAKLDLDKNFQRFYLGTTLRAENHRYDIDGTSRLPGYGTWDLRAGFDLAKNWSARVNVDNVLDKERRGGDYQNSYYVTPGRTFMLSVRYDFQP